MSSTVHVVRHGEVHNPDKILYGRQPGWRLSDRGQEMALTIPKWSKTLDLGALHVSPLQRAQETAAPSRRNQQQNSNGKLTCPSSGRTAFHHLVMWGETSCRAMSVRDLENAPEIMVASTSALFACDELRRCVRPTTSPKGTNLLT